MHCLPGCTRHSHKACRHSLPSTHGELWSLTNHMSAMVGHCRMSCGGLHKSLRWPMQSVLPANKAHAHQSIYTTLMVEVCLSCRSFHHAGVLIPTLETCCSQLVAAAGLGPFSAAREALLMTCCQTVLDVMSCSSYQGRVGASGSEERVRTCDPHGPLQPTQPWVVHRVAWSVGVALMDSCWCCG